MGIQGLLPALKTIITPSNISKFKGKAVAVDTYSWMHKAVYGYAEHMIADEDNLKWISYCLGYIDMILSHGITVYLVFDGDCLPAKEKTETLRASARSKNTEISKELSSSGSGNSSIARSHMARSIDVTPRMAAQLIRVCRQHRPTVKCVVSPYEADAQLSYLCSHNIVDAVISEDSDCIPYRCKEVDLVLISLEISFTYYFVNVLCFLYVPSLRSSLSSTAGRDTAST
jgi:exonuclease 1